MSGLANAENLGNLLVRPELKLSDDATLVVHQGPVFGQPVRAFTDLTGLLKPSEELTSWLDGRHNPFGTCLLVRSDGLGVHNASPKPVPEGIIESAHEALLETRRKALAEVSAAFPEASCSASQASLSIGRFLLIMDAWHADDTVLGHNNTTLRVTTSAVGTRFVPDKAEIDITTGDCKKPQIDGGLSPVFNDGGLSYFAYTTIHRSPSPREIRAGFESQNLSARPFVSLDIFVRK